MEKPNVKKNYIYRLSYEILTLIIPFITTPYVSRVLGADGIGVYSYTSSIMSYFVLFGALGTATYGAREISQHRDDKKESSKLFWEIELMTVITSGICLIVWFLVIILGAGYRYYFLALTPILLGTMVDISWYFTGLEQIKYIVIRNTMVKLLGIFLLFLLVKTKEDLIVYFIINSSVTLLGNMTMWMYLPKTLVKINWKQLTLKKHFKETLIYFIPTIATSVYTVLDKTLIGAITGSTYQNGYYEQANKIINIVKAIVFSSVNAVLGTRISYLFALNKMDEIKRRIIRSMDYILLVGFGCAFGICGIANDFVPIFFGNGFVPVVNLLYCMSPLIIIIGVSNCLGSQYYTPSGQRKQSAKYIILGSCVNLICNLLLIPQFGAMGATIGSIIAESVIAILYVNHSDGIMSWSQLGNLSWKRIVAGLLMLGCVKSIQMFPISSSLVRVIIQLGVGIVVYGLLLLILHDSMLVELLKIVSKSFSSAWRRINGRTQH